MKILKEAIIITQIAFQKHRTLEALQFIQFTLFPYVLHVLTRSTPQELQIPQNSGDNNVIIGMSWVKNAPRESVFGLFLVM